MSTTRNTIRRTSDTPRITRAPAIPLVGGSQGPHEAVLEWVRASSVVGCSARFQMVGRFHGVGAAEAAA
jgi:hypothetical protein